MIADKSVYARVGRLSAIIMILPSAMAAGWLLGYFVIDRWLNTLPWGTVTLLFIGAGGGFYEIFKILTADQSDHPEGKEH